MKRFLTPFWMRIGALFLLALVAGTAWTVQSRAKAGTYHFGTLAMNESLVHEFALKNESRRAREIISIQASCPCTSIVGYGSRLSAKEGSFFKVKITPDRLGPVKVRVDVEFKDGWFRKKSFWITGTVTAPESVQVRVEKQEDQIQREKFQIDPAELLTGPEWKNRALCLWIDVRPVEEFQRSHIPGSLNLPLNGLKTGLRIQGKNLVLLDRGLASRETVDAARQLVQAGAGKVRIMEGGLRGWIRSGGSVVGAEPVGAASGWLTPREAIEIQGRGDWILVGLEGKLSPQLKRMFSQPQLLSYPGLGRGFPEALGKLSLPDRKRSAAPNLLIISNQGENYELIEAELDGLRDRNVFYLRGGAQAFRDYLQNMPSSKTASTVVSLDNVAATLESSASGPRGGCPTCPN